VFGKVISEEETVSPDSCNERLYLLLFVIIINHNAQSTICALSNGCVRDLTRFCLRQTMFEFLIIWGLYDGTDSLIT